LRPAVLSPFAIIQRGDDITRIANKEENFASSFEEIRQKFLAKSFFLSDQVGVRGMGKKMI
jgi:hypothetical protein